MHIPTELICRAHKRPFTSPDGPMIEQAKTLSCTLGCTVPVVAGIPRFVGAENYAAGFGLQWRAFRKTQLDSQTGTNISRNRLERCFGASLNVLKAKSVLEVGCGAGRFTELMLSAGGRVFACDLSQAVEANYENCCHWPDYFVCQADVRELPIAPHSFDFVVCLGVIQHTPSPEETIEALARYVKPDGMLIIDHYSRGPFNLLRGGLRRLLIRLPAPVAKKLALGLGEAVLPLHRLFWNDRRGMRYIRLLLRRVSPLSDYYDVYPQLGHQLLGEWAKLDTLDWLTDHYKHLRTADEISDCLSNCGLVDLEVSYGGNGVEARARMPPAGSRQTK